LNRSAFFGQQGKGTVTDRAVLLPVWHEETETALLSGQEDGKEAAPSPSTLEKGSKGWGPDQPPSFQWFLSSGAKPSQKNTRPLRRQGEENTA